MHGYYMKKVKQVKFYPGKELSIQYKRGDIMQSDAPCHDGIEQLLSNRLERDIIVCLD